MVSSYRPYRLPGGVFDPIQSPSTRILRRISKSQIKDVSFIGTQELVGDSFLSLHESPGQRLSLGLNPVLHISDSYIRSPDPSGYVWVMWSTICTPGVRSSLDDTESFSDVPGFFWVPYPVRRGVRSYWIFGGSLNLVDIPISFFPGPSLAS